jgi:hypothetical protein
MSSNIDFKVGEKYENMKGVFEVVSIDGNSMVIRWDDGDSISTEMDFQQRVISRMQNERQILQKNKVSKKSKKFISNFGNEFKGLQESDFKTNVTGTNWRSRSCLGGAVTQRLDSIKYTFNSWAIYRVPMIHWGDEKKHDDNSPWFQSKYFAKIDDNNLYYGLYLEHSILAIDKKDNWSVFISWLNKPENEMLLFEILKVNDLYIYDVEEANFQGTIKPVNNNWVMSHSGNDQQIDSLYSFLTSFTEANWIGLQIGTIEKKEDAFLKGESIADDISKVFEILMPVFDASTNHNEGV